MEIIIQELKETVFPPRCAGLMSSPCDGIRTCTSCTCSVRRSKKEICNFSCLLKSPWRGSECVVNFRFADRHSMEIVVTVFFFFFMNFNRKMDKVKIKHDDVRSKEWSKSKAKVTRSTSFIVLATSIHESPSAKLRNTNNAGHIACRQYSPSSILLSWSAIVPIHVVLLRCK